MEIHFFGAKVAESSREGNRKFPLLRSRIAPSLLLDAGRCQSKAPFVPPREGQSPLFSTSTGTLVPYKASSEPL